MNKIAIFGATGMLGKPQITVKDYALQLNNN